MAQKILGLDLGTNSIGISVRNPEIVGNVSQQLEYFTSIIFPSGVGNGKSGEFSYAAERTKHRSARRLNQARRYRIWKTLEVLIQYKLCPLSMEKLNKWRTYDKSKGLKREYPTDAYEFEQWVRLDFDLDGIPEYTSPYQLRAELMTRQFDFDNEIERYKLGRAIYHIAQRRGFKSSKGETLQEQENVAKGDDVDMSAEMKKSEEKKSKGLMAYMQENETIGCAFYRMEQGRMRVRANEKYQAVRSLYEDEIRKIFKFQRGLLQEEELLKVLLSRKKGEGSIFYKRPLRSQKGMVGKCTFEKGKTRCPISRPEFEIYRAWTLINNLRYKTKTDDEKRKADREIDLSIRQQLFDERFVLSRDSFKMEDILKWLQKKDASVVSLNYDNKTSVMGCPVLYRIKALLGENWETARVAGKYNYEDLWHVCFTADDNEDVEEFVQNHFDGDEEMLKKMLALNGKIKTDYASLSLKAINNILYFLRQGYLYNEAVVLAKLPNVFGENWEKVKAPILHEWEHIKHTQESLRRCYKIANTLIAQEKLQEPENRLGFHDATYFLTEEDKKDVQRAIIDTLSFRAWRTMSEMERNKLQEQVEEAYQNYFRKEVRTYYSLENVSQAMETLIRDNFMDYVEEIYRGKIQNGDVLYHPSMVDIYPSASYSMYQSERGMVSKRLVQSPKTNVFRNPMVMRVLHTLRRHINQLIYDDIIDENTRIVIETAREFNDANWRWAIKKYQDDREKENKQYREELLRYLAEDKITETDIEKVRLWEEQGKRCLYTGRNIEIADLLNGDQYEIEHTMPRSKSFDDSLANKTICETHFNRYIKKNRCPKDLEEMYYLPLTERIKPWEEKISSLKKQITERKNKSKAASTKEQKDRIIRERHVLEMELGYWQDKVARFKKKEEDLTEGFRHSQLVDTRIITKYAYHLLRATFDQVTVQRGDMTAGFRKALGIQSIEEKKDRSKHSHHAIDATMLTLIPTNSARDAILDLFYKIEEAQKMGQDTSTLESEYQKRLKACNISGVGELPQFINDNILIRHVSKDQTLTPASRKVRTRGKIVKKNGKEMFQRGDILRGQLHLETWYGAIAEPQRDEQGNLMRDKDGHFLTTDKINYVVRTALKYKKTATDAGFKTWDELENVMVDKALYQYIRNQHLNQNFQTAIEEGIRDTQGKLIRHIRCYVPSVKNPISVKEQTYLSKKEYKQHYWAAMGDLYAMARYETEGKKPAYQIYSLFDISQNRVNGIEDIPQTIDVKGVSYTLVHVLHSRQQVLIYKEHPDELRGMNAAVLSVHLYVISGFENPKLIKLVHHLSAKKDGDIGKGESIKDYTQMPEKIRCGISTLKYLLEGVDFTITSKGIEFK